MTPPTFLRMVSMHFLRGWLYLMASLTFLTSCGEADSMTVRP